MSEDELKKAESAREARLKEIQELVAKANKQQSIELPLPIEDEDLGLESIDFSTNANPEESHKIWYQIESILKNNLPKGNDTLTKKLRATIREEKNIFLNRGKFKDAKGTRHSDGRMTFIEPFLSQALKITINWVSNGANPYALFEAFYDKNKELGYYD